MNKKIKEKIRITIDDVPHRSGMGSLEADVSGAAVDTLRLDQATGFSGNGPSQNDCHPLDHTSNLADDYKIFPGLAETKPASPRMTLASSRKTSNRLDAISVERRDTMPLMRQSHCRHGCERARCSRSGAQWLTMSNDETARASLNANNDRAGTVRPRLISHCLNPGARRSPISLCGSDPTEAPEAVSWTFYRSQGWHGHGPRHIAEASTAHRLLPCDGRQTQTVPGCRPRLHCSSIAQPLDRAAGFAWNASCLGSVRA